MQTITTKIPLTEYIAFEIQLDIKEFYDKSMRRLHDTTLFCAN